MAGTVADAVKLIRSWNGYSESDGRAFKYIIKPWDKWVGRSVNCKTPWCQITISSCLHQSSVPTTKTSGCKQAVSYYKSKKRWKKAGTKPSVGYQVFYDFSGKRKKPTHTGLVTALSGSTITVYEGNKSRKGKSDAVGARKISYKSKYIYGFGSPAYKK